MNDANQVMQWFELFIYMVDTYALDDGQDDEHQKSIDFSFISIDIARFIMNMAIVVAN